MKLNKKGFTLIELLGVICIIAIILGISTYGIINFINQSKDEAKDISIKGIKDASIILAKEDNNWKEDKDEKKEYYCTSIQNLLNRGILKKNADLQNYDKQTLLAVERDSISRTIDDVYIDIGRDSNMYKICSNNGSVKSDVIISEPEINSKEAYTSALLLSYVDGTFSGDAEISERKCYYTDSDDEFFYSKKEGIIDTANNTCLINGLKQNENYIVKIGMKIGDFNIYSDSIEVSTMELVTPAISLNSDNKVEISFNSNNIYPDNSGYYFKSGVVAKSDSDLFECSLNNDNFTCLGTFTNNIDANKWYMSKNNDIFISFLSNTIDTSITARISDGVNYKDKSENISIKPDSYTIKYNANGCGNAPNSQTKLSGSSINIADKISKNGYQFKSWNTKSDGKGKTYSPKSSYSTDANLTLYAICSPNTYNIYYQGNTADSQTYSNNISDYTNAKFNNKENRFENYYNINYGSDYKLLKNRFSKKGYTFNGWCTKKPAVGSTCSSTGGTWYDNQATVKNLTSTDGGKIILYAVWKEISTVSFTYKRLSNASDGNKVIKYTVSGPIMVGVGKIHDHSNNLDNSNSTWYNVAQGYYYTAYGKLVSNKKVYMASNYKTDNSLGTTCKYSSNNADILGENNTYSLGSNGSSSFTCASEYSEPYMSICVKTKFNSRTCVRLNISGMGINQEETVTKDLKKYET